MSENIESVFRKISGDKEVQLKSTVLHKADLSARLIYSAKFIDCDFRGTYFSESIFINCEFIACSLITAVFFKSTFINCAFKDSNMRHVIFGESFMKDCSFYGNDIFMADFSRCKLLDVQCGEDNLGDPIINDMKIFD